MDRTRLPELPTLDPGVQLLETDGQRAGGPLRALVLDHALGAGGDVRWIDSRGHARTDQLARAAPDPRVLDRIRIARGFTAHQHLALVRRLPDVVADAALVVLPALDAPYRADDVRRGRAFLLRSLATLARVAREHAVPVLVTRTGADGLGEPIGAAADETIECRRTAHGPRFVTDAFETLVYPRGDGTAQTTLAFWRRVLAARASVADDERARPDRPAPVEMTVDGAH